MRGQWKERIELVLDPAGYDNINKARDHLEKARAAFDGIDRLMNEPVSVKVLVEMYGQFQAALSTLDVGIEAVEHMHTNMAFRVARPEPEPEPEPESEPAPLVVFEGNDYRWLGRRQQAVLEALVLRERSTGTVVELSYLLETLHERKIVRGKAEFGRILERLSDKNLVHYDETHIYFTGEQNAK